MNLQAQPNISNLYKHAKFLQENHGTDNKKYREVYDQLMMKTGYEPREMEVEITEETARDLMSESQIFQLRQQILAYKYLIRSMEIPKDVERNLNSIPKEQWEIERDRIFHRSLKFYNEKIDKNEDLRKIVSEKIKNSSENTPNTQNDQINESTIKYFMEKPNYFVEKRKQELNNIISSGLLVDEVKSKLICELKFLEQKDLYLKLREKILGSNHTEPKAITEIRNARIFETTLLDRNYYRREKPTKKMEAKMVERFELQIKNEQEHRKKIKHLEFVSALQAHQTEFFEFHAKITKLLKKRTQGCKQYLDMAEKREQDKQMREGKARVNALRAQDFDEYLKLLEKTKNSRILELLNQTNEFLKQIGAKIKIQKGDNPDENNDEELRIDKEEKKDESFNQLKNGNKIYYNLTHSKKEEIKDQPSFLEGGALKSYQLMGLQWLVSLYNNNLNGILADEMGLGKTIQTIALFCYLMEFKKNFGPFLIVVPLTTLTNWTMEFEKWAPSIKKVVYKGSPNARKALAQTLKTTRWNVCITTYEYILKDRLTLNKFDWKYIVVDEGHRMKNSRSKFAQTLGQQYTSDHRLLLTGTPLQNNLAELWSLLNFLIPKVFSSCDDFEKWFSMPLNKITNNQEKETQLNEEEQLLIINRLHQVLRPFLLRRVKKEVESEIPNKVEFVIKVELSCWQKRVYEQVKKGVLYTDPNNSKMGSKALMNLMMQLRKICNHPYLFMNYHDLIQRPTDEIYRIAGKFELLDRVLPKLIATKHRILIFSQMTQLMDIMQSFFDFRGFKYLRLDGNTKADERGERMAVFNKKDSEFDIFLLSTRAGGLGLNLQSADTVIIFDSDWNPQMDLQAQDRAHRIGQKSEVRVFRLVTNTWIEEEILSKAAFKMNLDEIFIQAGLFNQKSTDSERRERLEDLLKRKNMYEELEDDIPNDEQINEMLARNEDEFNIFELMDRERYDRDKKYYPNFKEQADDVKFLNYRLITEEELPFWVKNPPQEDDVVKEYGRGNRQRKQVNYTDDLPENVWMRMLEDGIDPSEMNERASEYRDDKSEEDQYTEKSVGKLTRPKRSTTRNNIEEKQEAKSPKRKSLRSSKTQESFNELEDLPEDRGYRRLKKVKNSTTEKESLDKMVDENELGLKSNMNGNNQD